MKYKYCLFDLDGTLTDSGLGITNSVMYALDKFGIHLDKSGDADKSSVLMDGDRASL